MTTLSEFEDGLVEKFTRAAPMGFAIAVGVHADIPHWILPRYPLAWMKYYIDQNLAIDDPTINFALERTGHITWEELEVLYPGSATFRAARLFGFEKGNTIAISVNGQKSVASGVGDPWSPEVVHELTAALHSLHSYHAQEDVVSIDAAVLEVLGRMVAGYQDEAISEQLGISVETVRRRRRIAFNVTGTETTAELVAFLVRRGVL